MRYATSSGHVWPKVFSFLTLSHPTYTVLASPPPHFLLDRQEKLDQHLTVAISCNGKTKGKARCSLYLGVPCPRAALHSQGVMMVCLAAQLHPQSTSSQNSLYYHLGTLLPSLARQARTKLFH